MKLRQLLTLVTAMMTLTALGANVKETVSQVSEAVTVTDDVDYIVNGETPFTADGLVDLQNTEHAVLIIERIKPSKVISTLLDGHVRIKGAKAQDGVNCQVRLYGTRGSMILPYAKADKPLTVYSEQNFEGESSNAFGLENDGGYMVTMSAKQLNNRIRSFKLKRGYMVTFATGKSGYGYQRCFIANSEDLEFATLPQILDGKISSYRVFKWNTAGKKALASSTNGTACDELNVISCYDWGVGHDMYPDVECVANHLYEDYPTSAECGKATWTCHMKTNNEPRNNSDDKPQSLEAILANWQNLMRTGMRLCSPSSWDGSDYTDGSGFLNSFFQAIDNRGWRCDIADLHCYWLVDNFNNLGAMHSKYKRPIWISEWIWGASWNKNGAFESGKTDWDNEWAVKTICGKLNSYGYVERYFYWNSESKGKIYDGGLTVAGKWYANQLTGMGYNKSYEKIPNIPPMKGGFSDFRVVTGAGKATISWHDYDGEYNQVMEVLRKEPAGAWQQWKTISPEDEEADYTITDETWTDGVRYRLHIKSYSGRDYFSSEDMEPGEAIETSAGLRYVGGNVIPNGQFRMGMTGWTNGAGQPIGQPWFGVYPQGLSDGYFLQAFANHGKEGEGSLLTAVDIESGQDYVLRLAGQNIGDYVKLDVRKKGDTGDANKLMMTNYPYWRTQQGVFNSGEYDEALLSFRWLAGTAQLGDIELCRLFTTREEALADGVAWMSRKAEVVKAWNTAYPLLNDELQQRMSSATGDDNEKLAAMTLAVNDLLQAVSDRQQIDSLLTVARAVSFMDFDGREALLEAMETANEAKATASQITEACQQLRAALDYFLVMNPSATQPQSPDFSKTTGWQTKVGTYTEGDQRTATQQELTCWNAWWSGVAASEGTAKTLAISQQIGGLPEGIYAMECKASTQHYCLSDQHGYLKTKSENAVTPLLSRDYLDIPNSISAWQTLVTPPIYVSGPNDTLTIGFESSKQGAVDFAWRRYGSNESDKNTGDQREGWWCATDFRLMFHPVLKRTLLANQWGAVCLPYAYRAPAGVKLYRIAGLYCDYTKLCLEEVDYAEAATPYIYMSEQTDVTFYANGNAAKAPGRGDSNLRGTFEVYGKAPVGYYILKNGVWVRSTEREDQPAYSAVIAKAAGMEVLDNWGGMTMPIEGVEDELGPSGIDTSTLNPQPSIFYNLQGHRVKDSQRGVIIKTDGKGNSKKKIQ